MLNTCEKRMNSLDGVAQSSPNCWILVSIHPGPIDILDEAGTSQASHSRSLKSVCNKNTCPGEEEGEGGEEVEEEGEREEWEEDEDGDDGEEVATTDSERVVTGGMVTGGVDSGSVMTTVEGMREMEELGMIDMMGGLGAGGGVQSREASCDDVRLRSIR